MSEYRQDAFWDLKDGDLFEVKETGELFTVECVVTNPGGGQGMGAFPSTREFVVSKNGEPGKLFTFMFDPWSSHTYYSIKILGFSLGYRKTPLPEKITMRMK